MKLSELYCTQVPYSLYRSFLQLRFV